MKLRTVSLYDIRREDGSRDPELRRLVDNVLRWWPPQREAIVEKRTQPRLRDKRGDAIGVLRDLQSGSTVSAERLNLLMDYLLSAIDYYTEALDPPYPERNADALVDLVALSNVISATFDTLTPSC